ncbi:hypothetical protein TNCT_26061 [Trichonephila clavata]|uniref:Uncharacterized protein n=1 Tax=Trichonephila clavata TaxID=2740835 RepID=A0A8X6JLB5_TRICU|nr:hypothetical protein TNCT_26061 [Trichonephila clavata]
MGYVYYELRSKCQQVGVNINQELLGKVYPFLFQCQSSLCALKAGIQQTDVCLSHRKHFCSECNHQRSGMNRQVTEYSYFPKVLDNACAMTFRVVTGRMEYII